MKITILYDNTAWDKDLIADWGFACLVEAHGRCVLFDTGARWPILDTNMKTLGIDSSRIDCVFISHDHWDHTGGLAGMLKQIRVPVYVPDSFKGAGNIDGAVSILESQAIGEHIFSTGELKHIEQALVIQNGDELVVVAGCAHPGVGEILAAASEFGTVAHLVGGLHGFDQFSLANDLKSICPTHCTRHIREIAAYCPDKYIPGGAGKVISIDQTGGINPDAKQAVNPP